MSSAVEVYQECRARLIALADRLSEPQLRAPVPACPGWNVKDLYAHLVGESVDLVRNNMEGAPGAAWTARQVADRKDRTIAELIDEWRTHSSLFDKKLEKGGRSLSPLASDIWCHEYDISGALGWRGSREKDRVAWGARAIRGIPKMLDGTGLAIPKVIADGEVVVDGDGPVLRESAYELARMLYGRRSWDQIRNMDWDRDPEPYLEHLSFFPAPAENLID